MFEYQADENLLQQRTILVTGASGGIGSACAKSFASHGANVILSGSNQEKLEALYDEIEQSSPGKAFIQPLDLLTAGESDYQALANSVTEQFGALDGLVHNAALLGARSPIEFYPESDWKNLMQVNVNGAFLLTKALIPALGRSSAGRIVFTSSSVGRQGRAHWGAYAVTKFAVEGLMQVLADELKTITKIRINSVNPGATRTAMRRAAYPGEDPASVADAESLMPVYLYLMGPEGEHIHGQAINARDFKTGN